MRNIYVGNLDFTASEDQVEAGKLAGNYMSEDS